MNPRFQHPRAAYLHVPFCRHRCGYCNFAVIAGRDDLAEQYLAALGMELRKLGSPQQLDTLFIGGGTPTHLAPRLRQPFFDLLFDWFSFADDYELSCEANPADIDRPTVETLVENGVTRVSLGAQSFSPRKLQFLERDHDAEQIGVATDRLREAGLDVSLDLIFAVPGETLEEWQADLDQAVRAKPNHLSTYGLTFERGSRFWSRVHHGEMTTLSDEVEAALYELAVDRLPAEGFEHYEVSSFARPGHACRHNSNYWSGGTYFAFGPGAARHVAGRREINHASTTTYIRRLLAGGDVVTESERLDDRAAALERLVFGLRQLGGIDCRQFATETGFSVDQLAAKTIAHLRAADLLETSGDGIRVTRRGLLMCDSIAEQILNARESPPTLPRKRESRKKP